VPQTPISTAKSIGKSPLKVVFKNEEETGPNPDTEPAPNPKQN
jgi:hypothetical protein